MLRKWVLEENYWKFVSFLIDMWLKSLVVLISDWIFKSSLLGMFFLGLSNQRMPIPPLMKQTPSVSSMSLSIILWGTPTLTNIDHLSIMKSSVYPRFICGGITGQIDPKNASVHGNWAPQDPYIQNIGSNTRRYK